MHLFYYLRLLLLTIAQIAFLGQIYIVFLKFSRGLRPRTPARYPGRGAPGPPPLLARRAARASLAGAKYVKGFAKLQPLVTGRTSPFWKVSQYFPFENSLIHNIKY